MPNVPASRDPPRKQFTRTECATIEASGLFDQQNLELFEGDLIDRKGKTPRHVDAASLLSGWLIQVFGGRFVNLNAPIDVAPEDNPTNEPVPDLIVLKRSFADFRSAIDRPQGSAVWQVHVHRRLWRTRERGSPCRVPE